MTFFRVFGSTTDGPSVTGPFTTAGMDASVVYNAEGESGLLLDADVDGSGAVTLHRKRFLNCRC